MRARQDPAGGPVVRLVSFVDGAFLEEHPDGRLVVACRWGDVRVDSPDPPLRALLRRMLLGPVDPRNVLPPGTDAAPHLAAVDALDGCVVHSLTDASPHGPLLSAVPVAARGRLRLPERVADLPVRLSPSAVSRAGAGGMVVESPLSLHRVLLHRAEAVRLVGELAVATTAARMAAAVPGPGPAVVEAVVALLVGAGLAAPDPAPPHTRESAEAPPEPWSPYDLLFHNHRRPGRNGSTLVAVPAAPEGPAPPVPPRRVALPPVPPHADAAPRSARELDAACLGRLLGRRPRDPDGPGPLGTVAGIELYVAVDRSRDVPRGIYRYTPAEHGLTLVNDDASALAEIVEGARVAGGGRRRPGAVVTIAARMAHLPRPFGQSAYATALLQAGMAQERLRRSAVELGLPHLVLPTGDNESAFRALRLDGVAEVAVAEVGVAL